MNRRIWITTVAMIAVVWAEGIVIKEAERKEVGRTLRLNARIVQLPEATQAVVARLSGHVERYFVGLGERVAEGDKVALVVSESYADMTARYVSLRKQSEAAHRQRRNAETLYAKGVMSQDDYTRRIIETERIDARLASLRARLKTLGVDPEKVTAPTEKFVVTAHAKGVVSHIDKAVHSNVDPQTVLVRLVDEKGYGIVAYPCIADALSFDTHTRASVRIGNTDIPVRFVRLLPQVDETTQRAEALFRFDSSPTHLFLGAYVPMRIETAPYRSAVTVEAGALTMWQNGWVVFVPRSVSHDEGTQHERDESEGHRDEVHEEEHAHEEPPYLPVAVKVTGHSGSRVSVEGIREGTPYVADGVYFVKSLLLKGALGEHGH